MTGEPRSAALTWRAAHPPLSFRAQNKSVIGGRSSFCFASSAARVTRTPQPARLSPPSAVFASLTILRRASFGFAPAPGGTVSIWVMNMIRGRL